MSQLRTKFFKDDNVTDAKVRLTNNGYLRARNNAESADINIMRVNTSDVVEFASVPQVGSDPSSANDLVRKSYVDSLVNGIQWKSPAVAGTTANITLSGAQTIDGVSVIAGSRVLVKDQTAPEENGIYVASAGAWARAADMDSWAEVVNAACFVEQGTANADFGYVCTSDPGGTLNTTAVVFTVFTSASVSLVGADMIAVSGYNISVDLATASGLESSNPGNVAGQLRIKLEASNPTLKFSGSNEIGAKLDAAGAIITGASGLKSKVNAATLKINGSNELEGFKNKKSSFTLGAGDITNQYVDLGFIAATDSLDLFVRSGGLMEEGTDYSISYTGGAGGNSRITFLNDLATGGASALVSGDVLVAKFQYL